MRALIVTESIFGNTLAIADAIATGLAERLGRAQVEVVHASTAPRELPAEVGLLIVGAPTHTLSLPDASTRSWAASGAPLAPDLPDRTVAITVQTVGVREWIERVDIEPGVQVATFDTSIPDRRQLGTAARAAAVVLRGRGVPTTVGPSFDVTGMEGPLADGELSRATAWGRELAASV